MARVAKSVGAGAASGVLLALAGPPWHVTPLLAVALIPALLALLDRRTSMTLAAAITTGIGLGLNVPLAVVLQLPPAMSLGLVLGLGVGWLALGMFVQPLASRLSSWATLVVVPAAFVVCEFAAVIAVPVFGTAQSFVRAASAWPAALALASLAGFTGIVFVLVLGQTAVALVVLRRTRAEWIGLAAAAGLGVALAGVGQWRLSEPPEETIRVAAAGWTYDEVGSPWRSRASDALGAVLAPLVREAAAAGAELVVAPEAAFRVDAAQRQVFLDRAAALATGSQVTLVVGYFDEALDENHAAVFDPDGTLAGDYRKTHLIPGMEDYVAGDGTTTIAMDDALGVMICQDDNFRDLGRAYGRAGVSLMAVPTNDWRQVREFHLLNTTLRAADSGFGIVRGATNGISAVIDARGREIVRKDHTEQGSGVIVADLPLFAGGSLYARTGDWLPVACTGWLVLCAASAGRRRRAYHSDARSLK